jgi:type VI secretion system secreted protein VgrG
MSDYSHRHAELQFRSKEKSLFPIQFSIHEKISSPFEIDVFARSRKFDIDIGSIVGYGAALRATGVTEHWWTGIVRTMELTHAEETEGAVSTYYVKIVPALWLLTQRCGHRIFQHKTAIEIVEDLFKEWSIDFLNELKDTYPKLEYRVQYGETDFAFISRLMEEAGIWYQFRFVDKKSTVVLKDRWSGSSQVTIPYVDNPNEDARKSFVTRLHVGHVTRPGRFTVRDFDFRRPEYLLAGDDKAAGDPESSWQQYHYSPGGFLVETGAGGGGTPVADDKSVARHDDGQGSRIAKMRLEAARWKKRFLEFETTVMDLTPGAVFNVTHHPRADVNSTVCVIESQTTGNATGEFRVMSVAVFAGDPFRIPVKTPRPRIDGVQSAVVVGPKGEEIYTDEFGRVRVKFHWDREGDYDDKRTCWIRLSEGWAGPGYGAMTIPRVGHEVLVEFLDGDPDQPVVVGRLYNVVAPMPYRLPAGKTKSTWKTQTSPFVDGHFNELMFDDAATQELVYMQAQRNMMTLVKQHETRRVGADRTEIVGDHRLGIVARVDAVHVGERHLVQMVEAQDLKILTQEQPAFTERKTFMKVVNERIELTTGQAKVVLNKGDITIEAAEGIRFSADKLIILKGSKIYLNCSSASGVDPEAHGKAKDKALSVSGRTKTAILQLLGEDVKKEKLNAIAMQADVRTPPNGSIFWSGGGAIAGKAADQLGRRRTAAGIPSGRLESLEGGMQLQEVSRGQDWSTSEDAWTIISKNLANGVSGEVNVVVNLPVREDAILRDELVRLDANENVTEIKFLAVKKDKDGNPVTDPQTGDIILEPVSREDALAVPPKGGKK